MRRSAERLPCLFRHSRNTAGGSVSAHFVRGNAKGTPLACLSLSIKSFFRLYSVSRGSAHEIDFAKQNHKNREHVSRFLYSKREKVSAWELSDVRVLRSQNTDCRKNEVFRQSQARFKRAFFFVFIIFPSFLSTFPGSWRGCFLGGIPGPDGRTFLCTACGKAEIRAFRSSDSFRPFP